MKFPAAPFSTSILLGGGLRGGLPPKNAFSSRRRAVNRWNSFSKLIAVIPDHGYLWYVTVFRTKSCRVLASVRHFSGCFNIRPTVFRSLLNAPRVHVCRQVLYSSPFSVYAESIPLQSFFYRNVHVFRSHRESITSEMPFVSVADIQRWWKGEITEVKISKAIDVNIRKFVLQIVKGKPFFYIKI